MKLAISKIQTESECILLTANPYTPKVYVNRNENGVQLQGLGSSPDAKGANLELALYDLAKKWRAEAQKALAIAADVEDLAFSEGEKEHGQETPAP